MSKFKIKKLPPIKLVDLLKKKKTNLKQFLASLGITTYIKLEQKCNSLGVSMPPHEEFQLAVGDIVSSPQEGIIVLDSPTLLNDTGKKIQVDEMNFKHESFLPSKKIDDLSTISIELDAENTIVETPSTEAITIQTLSVAPSLKTSKKKEKL